MEITVIGGVVVAGLGALGGWLGHGATLRRDTNLNHGAIVTEYRGLLEDYKKELDRLKTRIDLLETKLTIAETRVEELQDKCIICEYRKK